jgi:ATP-dependent DNA helicase RecQ
MKSLIFFDTEVTIESREIKDFGAISADGEKIHTSSKEAFFEFMDKAYYICGHNVIQHDLKHLSRLNSRMEGKVVIDTLYFSPLLFPSKPYHRLIKDDKLYSDQLNNPLSDSMKSMDLFFDEVTAFNRLDKTMKNIFSILLAGRVEFSGFFDYLNIRFISFGSRQKVIRLIADYFKDRICSNIDLEAIINESPIELAYCLALINADDEFSITPPWVLKMYPDVDRVMFLLRNNPCLTGCSYCNKQLDPLVGLKDFFGYDNYRTFDGEPLQEKAVKAAIYNKSLLAVFPTGGGKSITFQVPALMAGRSTKGLTIVISPLQSLMKDQVDNLERSGMTDAVTINGLLDPIERSKAIERVADGSARILYISPESLRSRSIERLLMNRKIVRFVIDEAHCFSAWGQDFRVDYLYIGEFIMNLYKKKNLTEMIPVSCFTATAKQNVVADIQHYFREKLGLELELYTASAARQNLHYKVIPSTEATKYDKVRNLIDMKKCPTIVYVSRTRLATELAERLTRDGYVAEAYHGKMEKQHKSANQDAFIRGDVDIMVATSAFGMGVDKKDVGLVIHYQISDSLENYVQEAGRAGRDEAIEADCYVLYDDEDLNSHFTLLNQTKLNISEVSQIWKAIKEMTRRRKKVSNSALEIARKAGWDENIRDIETRVRTAIATLEQAGYVKRGKYANSICR